MCVGRKRLAHVFWSHWAGHWSVSSSGFSFLVFNWAKVLKHFEWSVRLKDQKVFLIHLVFLSNIRNVPKVSHYSTKYSIAHFVPFFGIGTSEQTWIPLRWSKTKSRKLLLVSHIYIRVNLCYFDELGIGIVVQAVTESVCHVNLLDATLQWKQDWKGSLQNLSLNTGDTISCSDTVAKKHHVLMNSQFSSS